MIQNEVALACRNFQFDYGFITEEGYRLGRVRALSIPGEDGLASYQYAGLDRTVKLTYATPEIDLSYISPDGAPGGDAGDPYTGWDRFGRTQDLRWSKGETVLDQTLYGYHRSSQRTWREAPLATSGNDEAYQYDGLYQITGRQRGDLNTNHTAIGGIPVRAEAFNHDPIGNCPRSAHALPIADSSSGIRVGEKPAASGQWQQDQVTTDGIHAADQPRVLPCYPSSSSSKLFHFSLLTTHSALPPTLTQIDASSALLAHDPAGNMTLCPPPADGDWDKALTLVWDVWNRLTEVRSEDGTTLIASYAYDGLWRRTTRRIGTGPVIHTYYNAQWRPLQETEQTGETTTLARTYDWGLRYRDDLIRRINHLEDDATHYALHDYYNVTAIVGCAHGGGSSSSSSESSADACDSVLERYGYSAFGDVRFMTPGYVTKPASDHAWELLYKAQFRDTETGFYNYGYRYLSPMLGRWPSRDPIGERGGLNLYGFVVNNGVNSNDQYGLDQKALNLRDKCNIMIELNHAGRNSIRSVGQVNRCSRYLFLGCKESTDKVNDDFVKENRGVPNFPRIGNEYLHIGDELEIPDPDNPGKWKWVPAKADQVNGKYGVGKEEFLKFIEDAWATAVAEAKSICKTDCRCKFVEIKFYCAVETVRILKLAGLEHLCSRWIAIPCFIGKSEDSETSKY